MSAVVREVALDLTFPKLAYGTHQIPWDLQFLLYPGAAALMRADAATQLKLRQLGQPAKERLPLIRQIHEVITAKIERGLAPASITYDLEGLWRFVAWADAAEQSLTIDTILQSYSIWADSLQHRVRMLKDLTRRTASAEARKIGDIVGRALQLPHPKPGSALLRTTSLSPMSSARSTLSVQADKQNFEHTFAFGRFLVDLCAGLTAPAVRGPLPLKIVLRDGRHVQIAGGLRSSAMDPAEVRFKKYRERAEAARAALEDGASLINTTRRSRLLNLRIEAELAIFVAQTGMNLSQATKLLRESYRWQTDDDDLLAFRVFKSRRAGEAIFRCFKAYRGHLKEYLEWLNAVGFNGTDERLFPFVYLDRIPAAHRLPGFTATRAMCRQVGIKQIRPRQLRKTRINWLLRRSGDPDLTAEQAAHSKQTLIGHYEQPHHQVAVAEIVRFHAAHDPTTSPPGDGLCVRGNRGPSVVPEAPIEAPAPDCISPDGCLFCLFHRDVLSADYCWKLASHAKLKTLELSLHKPPRNEAVHPAARVIDRISAKLDCIAAGSEIRAIWVRDAKDAVRAGRYHPTWNGHIDLLEVMV